MCDELIYTKMDKTLNTHHAPMIPQLPRPASGHEFSSNEHYPLWEMDDLFAIT